MKTDLERFARIKRAAEQKITIGGFGVIAGVILFILAYQATIIIGVILGVAGLIYAIIGLVSFSKLNDQFKRVVITSLVKDYVENGVFIPTQGLSKQEVYDTEFLQRADRFHSEDFLRGSMEGVQFVSSDVKLEERHVQHTKNGTRTYYETYFLGRIFIFDFNKAFDGYLQVLEKGSPKQRRGYHKIKLESVAFNKKFKTYTTNDHSAFYVLTPHFMEALMRFEQDNRGTICFSFIDNRLFIGINNFRDTFELQMFRRLDERIINEFERDLLVIKDVITELKLNKNIFKKGE